MPADTVRSILASHGFPEEVVEGAVSADRRTPSTWPIWVVLLLGVAISISLHELAAWSGRLMGPLTGHPLGAFGVLGLFALLTIRDVQTFSASQPRFVRSTSREREVYLRLAGLARDASRDQGDGAKAMLGNFAATANNPEKGSSPLERLYNAFGLRPESQSRLKSLRLWAVVRKLGAAGAALAWIIFHYTTLAS